MKPHTKIYLKHFNLTGQEFCGCEVCNARGVDVHHIVARGSGGDPTGKKDVIQNLQLLCRACHEKYGDSPEHFWFLVHHHAYRLGVPERHLLVFLKELKHL